MQRVHNVTRDVTLVERGRLADNVLTRFVGLMGVKHLALGDGLVISPCRGVHCMFMSIPIDVLYLSKDERVVGMDADLRPWRFGRMFKGVHHVLELQAGANARTSTAVGDQLQVTT